jgi:hypothetical protein
MKTQETVPSVYPGKIWHHKGVSAGNVALLILLGLILGTLLLYFTIFRIPSLQEWALTLAPAPEQLQLASSVQPEKLNTEIARLDKDVQAIDKKLDKFIPREPFLVINTSANHFWLYNYDKLIRDGMCSTGSYTVLQAGDQQEWIFITPRGMFKIKGKTESPVWRKPDWAFVEEGLPVPSQDSEDRYEYGVLGDYALAIGSGYLLHGTPYKRFLGMPVTHGCVRLGDEDLKVIYNSMKIGSKVFIF